MHFVRRFVTIVSSLAVLQLTLLGSTGACIVQRDAASPDSSHERHGVLTEASHDGQHARAHSPALPEHDTGTDCSLRLCAPSPALIAATGGADSDVPAASSVMANVRHAPASPVYSLDPPPPRS